MAGKGAERTRQLREVAPGDAHADRDPRLPGETPEQRRPGGEQGVLDRDARRGGELGGGGEVGRGALDLDRPRCERGVGGARPGRTLGGKPGGEQRGQIEAQESLRVALGVRRARDLVVPGRVVGVLHRLPVCRVPRELARELCREQVEARLVDRNSRERDEE